MNRQDVMMHYRPQERPFVDRTIDLVARVDQRQAPVLTDFLDPRQLKIVEAIAHTASEVSLYRSGGHELAERQRALLVPSYWVPETDEFELSFLRFSTIGDHGKLKHGDYLGALVGLGLKRSKLGDLAVHDQGCDLVTTKEIADYIRLSLSQVGRSAVQVQEIQGEQFVAPQVEYQEKEFTVMSLRVDAVAGEAFGLSRSKVVDPIKSGKLQLNWQVIDSPATAVEEGDVMSLRGHGRAKVLAIIGQSRKGRTILKIGKYL